MASSSSTVDLLDENGDPATVAQLGYLFASAIERGLCFVETTAAAADAREQNEQPRVVHGRELVAKEALRIGELPLGLDKVTLAREHDAERRRSVRTEPGPSTTERAEDRFRLLCVGSGGSEPSAFGGDERKGRSGERVARRPGLRG